MKIIIDSRMRKEEREYLSKFGELVEIKSQTFVYKEISAHPDIFFAKINDTIFRTPNLNLDENIGVIGAEAVGSEYPDDVKYNVCQIGEYVVHNFKYTDKKVLNFIETQGLKKLQVNQGYSNCSICTISNNACITSDYGINNVLKGYNIDCLLLTGDEIYLLDENGVGTGMNGFIGGASCVIDNKFILFGDSNFLKNKNELINFLDKYNFKLIDFKGLKIHDYGGIICA